jgi:hypothetical protein
MSTARYNFKDHVTGDTFAGVQFEVLVDNTPLDLTDADIFMHVKDSPVAKTKTVFSTDNGKLEINDAAAGKFKFKKQVIDLFPKEYVYDIEIHLSDGGIYTYIEGTWLIKRGITVVE